MAKGTACGRVSMIAGNGSGVAQGGGHTPAYRLTETYGLGL